MLVCTKTDNPEHKLNKKTEKSILRNCKRLIQKIGDYKEGSVQLERVSLLSEILHTSSATIPGVKDTRKSPKDLQNIVAAINRFNAKREFVIPKNWNEFGKFYS